MSCQTGYFESPFVAFSLSARLTSFVSAGLDGRNFSTILFHQLVVGFTGQSGQLPSGHCEQDMTSTDSEFSIYLPPGTQLSSAFFLITSSKIFISSSVVR
jgi:hypothetical protein